MGPMMAFPRPDGQEAQGHLAEPAAGSTAPAVVVMQEWWGLNDQMKGIADRLAQAGYRALVPDLYRGRVAATPDEANHMMTGLDWNDATHQDLRGAAQYLRSSSSRVAVLGFCMGGALTLAAAVHVPEVDAAVCYYGIPPREVADPARARIPILGHFATQDDWCTPDAVRQLDEALTTAGVPHEFHSYEAQHAFANEMRPEVHDAEAARLAWQRSLDFLQRHLGA